MRHAVWVAVALLAGLVAGSWGPRAEVRDLRRQLAERGKETAGGRAETQDLEGVVRMLRIPTAAPESDTVKRSAEEPETAPAPPPAPEREAPSGETGEPAPPPAPERRDMEQDIEEAIDMWRVRSEAARNALVAHAGLNPRQAADFDVLVAAMNVRLARQIEGWVERLQAGDKLALPETGARMIHDLSGALVLTYDELDRKMPGGWRDASGNGEMRFDLVDFIDPSVARPLIGVQDRLREARSARRRRP